MSRLFTILMGSLFALPAFSSHYTFDCKGELDFTTGRTHSLHGAFDMAEEIWGVQGELNFTTESIWGAVTQSRYVGVDYVRGAWAAERMNFYIRNASGEILYDGIFEDFFTDEAEKVFTGLFSSRIHYANERYHSMQCTRTREP